MSIEIASEACGGVAVADRSGTFFADFSATIPRTTPNGERVEAMLNTPDGDLVLMIVKIADLPPLECGVDKNPSSDLSAGSRGI